MDATPRDAIMAAMAMSATKTTPGLAQSVREWRIEQLKAAGYPHPHALVIAERLDVDLHLSCRLLAQGCPAELALRILL